MKQLFYENKKLLPSSFQFSTGCKLDNYKINLQPMKHFLSKYCIKLLHNKWRNWKNIFFLNLKKSLVTKKLKSCKK